MLREEEVAAVPFWVQRREGAPWPPRVFLQRWVGVLRLEWGEHLLRYCGELHGHVVDDLAMVHAEYECEERDDNEPEYGVAARQKAGEPLLAGQRDIALSGLAKADGEDGHGSGASGRNGVEGGGGRERQRCVVCARRVLRTENESDKR